VFPGGAGYVGALEELRILARNGLREIAVRALKSCGPRLDAVICLLDAMRLFSGRSLDEVREISFDSSTKSA
jgi:hypothetical protein